MLLGSPGLFGSRRGISIRGMLWLKWAADFEVCLRARLQQCVGVSGTCRSAPWAGATAELRPLVDGVLEIDGWA